MDIKKKILTDLNYFVMIESCKVVVPYPAKSDTLGKSLEDLSKIKGFETLINTVNNLEMATILRQAALNHILTLLSDEQLYTLLLELVEESTIKDN
jgi:hypothetical protein